MTRLLFIDFDGVINAMGHRAHKVLWGDTEITRMDGFEITYSPTLVEEIEMLAEAGITIIWLTTWCAQTAQFTDIGFSHYPWIGEKHRDSHMIGWWKWAALQDYLETVDGDPTIVWIDDDLDYSAHMEPDIQAFLDTDGVAGISPSVLTGITPDQLDEIRSAFGMEPAVKS